MKNQFLNQVLKAAGLLFFCFMFSNTSFAQAQARQQLSPEQRATQKTDRMKAELSLTDDQYKRIYALNLEKANAMQQARKEEADRKAEREKYHTALKSILTPEQMAKMKEKRKDHRKGSGKNQGKVQMNPQKAPATR